jgi:hypothetical protein
MSMHRYYCGSVIKNLMSNLSTLSCILHAPEFFPHLHKISPSSTLPVRLSGEFPTTINLDLWVLQRVDRTPWTWEQPCPKADAYTGRHKHKRGQTSMSRVRLEPTIPGFEQAKIFCILDRKATVTDIGYLNEQFKGSNKQDCVDFQGYTGLLGGRKTWAKFLCCGISYSYPHDEK